MLHPPGELVAMLKVLGGVEATITSSAGVEAKVTLLLDEHTDPQVVGNAQPGNPYSVGHSQMNATELVALVSDTELSDPCLQDASVEAEGETFRVSYFDHNDGYWRLELRRF